MFLTSQMQNVALTPQMWNTGENVKSRPLFDSYMHPLDEYITLKQIGGNITGTRKNYLYIRYYRKISTYRSNSEHLTSDTFKEYDYAFLCKDEFPVKKDYELSLDHPEKLQDNFCDMNGKKVISKKGCRVIGVGLLNDEHCYFWLEDQEFHVHYQNQIITVPFSHTYVTAVYMDDGFGQEKLRRFDYLYREINKLKFVDMEDTEDLSDLSSHMSDVNIKYSALLTKEIEKTREHNLLLEPSELISQVEIKCIDGSFMFYPPLLPVLPKMSIFTKTHFKQEEINVDHELEDVKQIFRIYLSTKLPSSQSLIRGGLLVICYELSRYFDLEFYESYFNEIIHHISFVKVVIPEKGSVEDYLQLLEGLNLEEAYKELYSKVHSTEFYTALHELGLSRQFLAKSMQFNSSPYLMEFLEL